MRNVSIWHKSIIFAEFFGKIGKLAKFLQEKLIVRIKINKIWTRRKKSK